PALTPLSYASLIDLCRYVLPEVNSGCSMPSRIPWPKASPSARMATSSSAVGDGSGCDTPPGVFRADRFKDPAAVFPGRRRLIDAVPSFAERLQEAAGDELPPEAAVEVVPGAADGARQGGAQHGDGIRLGANAGGRHRR